MRAGLLFANAICLFFHQANNVFQKAVDSLRMKPYYLRRNVGTRFSGI
jgi:DNA topoisomerase VI subunit B